MKKITIVSAILISAVGYSQKSMTTNAAMGWKAYQTSKSAGDKNAAERDILEAIEYITKSANHESTKNDPKTLMYKGKIYSEAVGLSSEATDATLKAFGTPENKKAGIDAFKKSTEFDKKGRYEDDIYDYCHRTKAILFEKGRKAYADKKFEVSMNSFLSAADYAEAMGITDSMAIYYGGISAYNSNNFDQAIKALGKSAAIGFELGNSSTYLAESYSKVDKKADGITALEGILSANAGNKDVMISLINIYLSSDEKAKAEKVLSDAISVDPNNKELHFVVGTIYEEQERYDDAEKAYKKVLELDPKYATALLRLGAVYFNKAADINGKINDLSVGDPQEEVYRTEMTENFKKALPFLEQANEITPNNLEIISSLRQAYYKTGNTEKAKEMKVQLDVLKKK